MIAAHAVILRMSGVLPQRDLRHRRVDERAEQLIEGDHPLGNRGEVVVDVTEVRAHLVGDKPRIALGKPLERGLERHDRAPQLQHFALHEIDLLGADLGSRGKNLRLHLVDVRLDPSRDVEVMVDDVVGDRVQHRRRTKIKPLRFGVEFAAQPGQPGVVPVAAVITKSSPRITISSPVSTISLAVVGDSCST